MGMLNIIADIIFTRNDKTANPTDDAFLKVFMNSYKRRTGLTRGSSIIAGATKEADEITSKAQERARALVNQEAIFKEAKEKAEKIITAAEEQANEILRGAFTFSDNILLDTENAVNQNLETVRQARKNLRTAVKTRAAANRARRAENGDQPSDSEQE